MEITTLHPTQTRGHIFPSAQKTVATSYVSNWAVVVGRLLFSLIFIVASFHHFSRDSINLAIDQGVPMANIAVPMSGVMALLGGLSILFHYKTKIGAALIILFLVPVTLMMHNFWAVYDPGLRMMQEGHFMKNLALIGAAILIYQYSPTPFLPKSHQSR
jgi:putative oxidoreductase